MIRKQTKRAIYGIAGLGVASLVGWAVFARNGAPRYTTAIVETKDIAHTVQVTGKVKSQSQLDLALERGGRIAEAVPVVGDRVEAGATLARLDNGDVVANHRQAEARVLAARASVVQSQAALSREAARYDELRAMPRAEDVAITKAKLESAKQSAADAQVKLADVRATASTTVFNPYDTIPQLLEDASAALNTTAYTHLDPLFVNDDSGSPQLSFSVADFGAKVAAENSRVTVQGVLRAVAERNRSLASGESLRDQALLDSIRDLERARDAISACVTAVDAAVNLSSTSGAAYKLAVTTAKTELNTEISGMRTHIQKISAQRTGSAETITAATIAYNAALQAVMVAERELALKSAGATLQELAAQQAEIARVKALIASEEAQVTVAQAAVLAAAAEVGKTILRAPVRGVVTKRDVEIGEIISPNTILFSLMPETPLIVEAFIPEVDSPRIRAGQKAVVALDAYGSGKSFEAMITSIDPAATLLEGVSTYRTILELERVDDGLRAGMTGIVTITTDTRVNALALPIRAVQTVGNSSTVRVLGADGVPREVAVTLGIRGSEGEVEAVSGVNPGDAVIVDEGK